MGRNSLICRQCFRVAFQECPTSLPGAFHRHLSTNQRNKSTDTSSFPLKYNPKAIEAGRYGSWMVLDSPTSPESYCALVPFSLLLPPPNITGNLHLGHVLTTTVQDVFTRWHKMSGKQVLWIPGMDHAGIATQVVVEKILWQNKRKTRHDIGREGLFEEVNLWKDRKTRKIRQQLQNLGALLNWSHEFFTLDTKQSAAVVEAFIQLYNDGLIYRSESLVNWSCSLQSSISDIEVTHSVIDGPTLISAPGNEEPVEFGVLYDFGYKICGQDEEIVVSTTRIETMLGDVAIAVHPDDHRYKHLHGKKAWHPFREEEIPIIADAFVDPAFGTGAVKLTPAHNQIDYEVSRCHNLPLISIISEDGTLNENCGKFTGMRRFDARKIIISELEKLTVMKGRRDHKMQIPICSRSGDVVEYILKPQWYINSQEMAEKAALAVRDGRLKIEPTSFESTWFSYLENIRDWCISRQLWWGHQIPLYKCQALSSTDSEWIAARNIEEAQKKAADIFSCSFNNISITQEEDVLDTWFSSALLPFSALGWPNQNEDMKRFYPLSMMITGHDILFFWVARMVMLGEKLTGQLPFKKVLLHGVICDAHGRKMSKSRGNVISPEHVSNGVTLKELQKEAEENFKAGLLSESELQKSLEGQKKLFPSGIPECGTDALRFSLLSQNIQNISLNFDTALCHTNRLFCNKIWQACRYVHMFCENVGRNHLDDIASHISLCDRWILSRLAMMVHALDAALKHHQLHLATSSLRSFIYSDFCDTYLEITKPLSKKPQSLSSQAACWTLLKCTDTFLRSLSPFMPFVTDALHSHLRLSPEGEPLTLCSYPKPDQWTQWINKDLERDFSKVLSAVSSIRQIMSLCEIQNLKPQVHIETAVHQEQMTYGKFQDVICLLTNCADVTVGSGDYSQSQVVCVSESLSPESSLFVILEKMQVTDKMRNHINKKNIKLAAELEKMQAVVSADGYKSKASLQIQEKHAQKIKDIEAKLFTMKKIEIAFGKNEAKRHEM